jgi:cytochrome c oxidase subunit II
MLNNFPLWPQQASTLAPHVDALYIFLLIVTGMMALLVFVVVIFFAARFRHRPGVRAEQIEGSTALEITWSAIPFAISW